MGKRATLTTQEYLVNAALPEATETYTVIPHGSIIDKVRSALAGKNLEIERELYRCNQGARIAQGVYHLRYGKDPDMSMMFAWSNSYDKSMKFKCSIGGYVHSSLSSIIGTHLDSAYDRKHTGSADNEAFDMIDSQILKAEEYFEELINDKETMKKVSVSELTRAELMGRIYFINELLTSEQLSTVKIQFAKPSFTCSGEKDSLWCMYNAIIMSLHQAHPKTWMDQQRLIHWFLCDHFDIKSGALRFLEQNDSTVSQTVVDPNQLDLVVEIEKIESKETPVATEPELNHELHGVDNDNVEMKDVPVVEMLREEADAELAFAMDGEPAVEVSEPVDTLTTEEGTLLTFSAVPVDDNSWPCLECGTTQAGDAPFYDGQICEVCHKK